MAPTAVNEAFPQRRLRSSSVATPKKNYAEDEENLTPATEVKRKTMRASRNAKVVDASLRKVVPSTVKNRASSLARSPFKAVVSPLKSIQLSKSPSKRTGSPAAAVRAALFEDSPRKSLFRADLTRYAEARTILASSIPDEVVGREKQFKAMREFLENNLRSPPVKKSKKAVKKSIYVSGPPGTGKTTCLKKMLAEMPQKNLRTVFVNCMSLGRSGGIFGKVVDTLCPQKTYSNMTEAQRILEEEVVKTKDTILLILDEVDQLDSKSQEVLYTLFELPYLNKSKLVLVGIANALDLTDRILPRLKLREAFCPAELTFPAYTKSEIVSILKGRLSTFIENQEKPLFQPRALEFLAGKISALSGDIRKALDVCRRAIELAEVQARKQTILKPLEPGQVTSNGMRPIDVPQILRIVNEIYCSSVTAAIRSGASDDLPMQQKLLIASMLLMSNHRPNRSEITLGKLHETYARVCKKRGMTSVDLSEAGSMCGLLESRGILSIKHGGPWASAAKDKKLSLRIDEGEVEAALKDKTLLSGILNDIECVAK